MIRFILPIIFVGIAVAGIFTFTNPLYKDIIALREQVASYNEALGNSKALESERDLLTNKLNQIDPGNLAKLQRLLPDNVDNIRLILEIEKIATPYGMVLKNVKYEAVDTKDAAAAGAGATIAGGETAAITNRDYGTWNLGFSTEGTYNNFNNFIKDLEKNLRIVDISSISFSSSGGTGLNPSLSSIYTYDFKIKTYWLTN